MSKLRQAMTRHVMNEDATLKDLRRSLNLKASKPSKDRFWLRNGIISISLIALVILGTTVDNFGKGKQAIAFATIVSIDINPSFTLKVDANNLVVEIEAENEDAQAITVSDLIGQDAVTVVETIILRAQEAGYLVDPTKSDYVLVTTAPAKAGDEDEADHLNDLIQNALDQEDATDDVNVALIKATLQQWFDAQEKNVPLGLFVINGLVNVNGEVMSVSDFLKTSGNLELLQTISTIIKKTTQNTTSFLERFLDRLERAGVDVAAFRTRLATPGENLVALKQEVLSAWAALDPDTKAGSSLSEPDKLAMVDLIKGMLDQLQALGIDVSGYRSYLAGDYPDLQGLEKELVALLKDNGVDTQTGSTLTDADRTIILSELGKKLDQLALLGVDVTALRNRLNGVNPDFYALETDINALLNANGVDTSTGSTVNLDDDDDDDDDDKEDGEDHEDDEHEDEHEVDDD